MDRCWCVLKFLVALFNLLMFGVERNRNMALSVIFMLLQDVFIYHKHFHPSFCYVELLTWFLVPCQAFMQIQYFLLKKFLPVVTRVKCAAFNLYSVVPINRPGIFYGQCSIISTLFLTINHLKIYINIVSNTTCLVFH